MPPDRQARSSISMTASARLVTEQVAGGDRAHPTSRVRTLRSQAPLVLRPIAPHGPEPLVRRCHRAARVSLASGAAGPLGGDDLALDITVGPGSTLLLSEVSSTLLLPGARGGRSHLRITITVQDDATLAWFPEPLIAAAGCHHLHEIDITLGARARLMMRDELVLGRYGEQPGRLSQHLRVRCAGQSAFQQCLDVGTGARAWDSPAVLGGHKCVGTVLALDPQRVAAWPPARSIGASAAMLPLHGPGLVISALAGDTVHLRRLLDQGIDLLGDPWRPEPCNKHHAAPTRTMTSDPV